MGRGCEVLGYHSLALHPSSCNCLVEPVLLRSVIFRTAAGSRMGSNNAGALQMQVRLSILRFDVRHRALRVCSGSYCTGWLIMWRQLGEPLN